VNICFRDTSDLILKPSQNLCLVYEGLLQWSAFYQNVEPSSLTTDGSVRSFGSVSYIMKGGVYEEVYFQLRGEQLLCFKSIEDAVSLTAVCLSQLDASNIVSCNILGKEKLTGKSKGGFKIEFGYGILLEIGLQDGNRRILGVLTKDIANEWKSVLGVKRLKNRSQTQLSQSLNVINRQSRTSSSSSSAISRSYDDIRMGRRSKNRTSFLEEEEEEIDERGKQVDNVEDDDEFLEMPDVGEVELSFSMGEVKLHTIENEDDDDGYM
jgi:hypothetical protein